MYSIQKYNRYWAVYKDTELIVVTVYKKGAQRIVELLTERGDQLCANQ